ncbi:MAG: sodium:calcium antiporter [Archaeoglobaceae archaeon]|nr:sodium:calcium antiporter [Archaeoglobaceae archaeon]MDW8013015.1 sodium:calcium antiporter [Archaeoglobaceae archaeon]
MGPSLQIIAAVSITLPWLLSYLFKINYSSEIDAFLSGIAIFGAAIIISWAAETAEIDVPRSFSLAIVALLAILPEYAVDGYFAYMAGKVGGDYVHYTAANMTGANRLLIGIGWSLVIFLAALKIKKRFVELDEKINLEVFFLLAATIYSFKIPLTGAITIFDSLVLVFLFVAYVFIATRAEREECELMGVPKYLSCLKPRIRRSSVILMFLYAAMMIFISVKAFAEGLIASAKKFGIEEFIVVQWIAPLASEAPEFIVAAYLVNRLRVSAGMNALISAKVNQWSLLIGTIAIIYSLSSLKLQALPLDARQKEEFLLTAAQSLFGLAVILDRKVTVFEASLLFILFTTQLLIPSIEARYIFSFIYLTLAIPILFKKRVKVRNALDYVLHLTKRTPYNVK